MWQAVHISKKREQAEQIKQFLQAEGFWAEVVQGDLGGFEIRVPSSEAEEAAQLLQNYHCSFGKNKQRGLEK